MKPRLEKKKNGSSNGESYFTRVRNPHKKGNQKGRAKEEGNLIQRKGMVIRSATSVIRRVTLREISRRKSKMRRISVKKVEKPLQIMTLVMFLGP